MIQWKILGRPQQRYTAEVTEELNFVFLHNVCGYEVLVLYYFTAFTYPLQPITLSLTVSFNHSLLLLHSSYSYLIHPIIHPVIHPISINNLSDCKQITMPSTSGICLSSLGCQQRDQQSADGSKQATRFMANIKCREGVSDAKQNLGLITLKEGLNQSIKIIPRNKSTPHCVPPALCASSNELMEEQDSTTLTRAQSWVPPRSMSTNYNLFHNSFIPRTIWDLKENRCIAIKHAEQLSAAPRHWQMSLICTKFPQLTKMQLLFKSFGMRSNISHTNATNCPRDTSVKRHAL